MDERKLDREPRFGLDVDEGTGFDPERADIDRGDLDRDRRVRRHSASRGGLVAGLLALGGAVLGVYTMSFRPSRPGPTRPPAPASTVPGQGPGASAPGLPTPLTQADVDSMDIVEVRRRLVEVVAARQHASSAHDEQALRRLERDFDLLMDRLRTIDAGS